MLVKQDACNLYSLKSFNSIKISIELLGAILEKVQLYRFTISLDSGGYTDDIIWTVTSFLESGFFDPQFYFVSPMEKNLKNYLMYVYKTGIYFWRTRQFE